mmetsp:Transcript_21337/g.49641  ORF Transcript_21337/g.49641 Transcript_21337/m.49641 type:complete len:295 (+) Transcript_21337:287-1171(+)
MRLDPPSFRLIAVHVEPEVAVVLDHITIFDLNDGFARLTEEPPVVAHDDNCAVVFAERELQGLLHGHVKMVGRLIKDQHLRRNEHHADNGQSRLLATGEAGDFYVHAITTETELLHDLLQLPVVHQDFVCFLHHLPSSLLQREEIRLVLREEACHFRISGPDLPAVGWLLVARQEAKQGRLPLPITADNADLVSRTHHEVAVLEETVFRVLFCAITVVHLPCLSQNFQLSRPASVAFRLREPEGDPLHERRWRVHTVLLQFLQLLDALLASIGQGLHASVHFDELFQLLALLLL